MRLLGKGHRPGVRSQEIDQALHELRTARIDLSDVIDRITSEDGRSVRVFNRRDG